MVARDYVKYIAGMLAERQLTGCLSTNLSDGCICLAFIHRGRYVGSFHVDDQQFSSDISNLNDLLEADPKATCSAYLLPPENDSKSQPGFSLSMAVSKD